MIRVVRCYADGDHETEDEMPMYGAFVPDKKTFLIRATPLFIVQSLQRHLDDKTFTEDEEVHFTYKISPKRALAILPLSEFMTYMRVLANELTYARSVRIEA